MATKQKQTLRLRLTLTFFGLALSPLILVAAIVTWQSIAVLKQNALNLQQQIVQRISIRISSSINGFVNELDVITGIQGFQKLSRQQQIDMLNALQIYNKALIDLAVLDADGREQLKLSRLKSITANDLQDRSQTKAFKIAYENHQPYFSPVEFDTSTGDPLMTIAVPMRNGDTARLTGVLRARVSLSEIWSLISLLGILEGENIYIVDAQGRVIAHLNPQLALTNVSFKVPNENGFHTGIEGVPVIMAIERMAFGDQQFICVAERATSMVIAPAIKALKFLVGVFVIVIGIASALGLLAVKRIVEPIQTLARTARSIRSGDLNRTAKIDSRDEIGDLTIAFNSMTRHLKESLENLEAQIAERRKTEQNLRESETRYRQIFENIQDAYFEATLDGQIIEVSPSIEAITRLQPDEIINQPLHAIAVDAVEIQDLMQQLLNHERVNEFECHLRAENYRQRICSISARILKTDDKHEAKIVGSIRDITERKTTEAEKKYLEDKLARSQKMEALGLLAGGVAHDLNNVLSGIVSYPDLLLMELPEASPLEESILTIKQSGLKAAAIVQDLLTLARRGVTNKDVLNLKSILEEYLRSPEHEALMMHHPDVRVVTAMEKNILNMHGSAIHLKKTIMNLIVNAAEAQPAGGRIKIAIHNTYVDKPIQGYDNIQEGEYVALVIQDDGLGIAPNDINRIFEPFYTKKVMGRSGTGLGMAVVWGTVQDHQGYIDVKSTEGQGTTFSLYFPVCYEALAVAEEKISLEQYIGNGETILVVDDIESQRQIASSLLAKLGYRVSTAASGLAAVTYLKKHSVDLVVLDMIMDPGIDGLETYRQILQVNAEQRAIIASGYSETERVREALSLGAGKYIKKPYTLEKLGLAVRTALANPNTCN